MVFPFPRQSKSAGPFRSTDETVRYVEAALESAVPDGWTWSRNERQPLAWLIRKTDIRSGEWPNQEYSLHASRELRAFVLTYDNKDVGALTAGGGLLNAKLIEASAARLFGLDALLRRAFAWCPPNEWGYT